MRGKGFALGENHETAKTAALFFGVSRVVLRGCLKGFGVVDGTAKVFFFFFFKKIKFDDLFNSHPIGNVSFLLTPSSPSTLPLQPLGVEPWQGFHFL